MRPNAIYNFVQLLESLRRHDWAAEPYVLLLGPRLSGKTRIHSQLLRQLKDAGLLISLDARDTLFEDHMVQRALVCAQENELTASRATLQSTRAVTVIAGSSFNNSTLRIRSGGLFRRRRSDRIDVRNDEGGTVMVSTLISDIIAVRRDVYIVVDHFDEAAEFLHRFVKDIALRMGGLRPLRIMLVGETGRIEQSSLEGIEPTVYEVPKLSAENIHEWARALGLEITADNARMLHSLTEKGLAGVIRTELVKLMADDDWRTPVESARTS